MKEPIDLFVPASCAHLGPGFGVLGLAIDRGLTLRAVPRTGGRTHEVVRTGGETGPQLTGRLDPILRGLEAVGEHLRLEVPPLRIEVSGDVPLGIGLGSDAAAHVAGARIAISAATAVRQAPTDEALLEAVVAQGADAVHAAASLSGGLLSLLSLHPRPGYRIMRFPLHPLWNLVVAHPARSHASMDSARMLPATLPHPVAPRTAGRMVALLRALIEGDAGLVHEAMRDEVHVPYRRRMVEGMTEAMEAAARAGAAAATICGHGPGVVAFVLHAEDRDAVAEAMVGAFEAAGTPAKTLHIRPLEADGRPASA